MVVQSVKDLDAAQEQIHMYNGLKKLVDHCSFDVSIGKENLIKQKNVDLEKLISLLLEAIDIMKTHLVLFKTMKNTKVSISEFNKFMKLFEK